MDILGNAGNLPGDPKCRRINSSDEFEYIYNEDISLPDVHLAPDQPHKKYFLVAKTVTILVFVGLFAKLFMSQIIYGSIAENLAQGNRIRPRIISAARGLINDASGIWLARNVPTFDLTIRPSDLPKDKSQRQQIYDKLNILTGIDSGEIMRKSENEGLQLLDSVTLKENLSREDSLLYEEKIAGLNGVEITKRASRQYNNSVAAISHFMGYTGKLSKEDKEKFPDRYLTDWVGKAGLELSYENNLHGADGIEQIEVDRKGSVERVLSDNYNKDPVSGDSLSLYLDAELQNKSAQFLSEGIENAKILGNDQSIKSGVVIAMNPKNGGILSMVSLPSYDNNLFAAGISSTDYQALLNDPAKPLFNRALFGQYPPGSTIKPEMAAAGLSEGVININTAFDTPAEIKVGDFVFPDWKDHGFTNVETAIAESNNIFFYSVGGGYDKIKGLGIDRMKKWWQRFGYGEKTGIDLPSESVGLLPDPAWKKKVIGEPWYIGDTYHAAIGQGDLLVTPMQMVRMISAIANGGQLLQPQMVKSEIDANGKLIKEFAPRIENTAVTTSDIIKIVQQGMRKTMQSGGSAYSVFGDNFVVPVAGKTGTAQFFNNQKTHAWFECYAPYDNPQIALLVMVEGGGGGHEVAAPIAKNILQYYFSR